MVLKQIVLILLYWLCNIEVMWFSFLYDSQRFTGRWGHTQDCKAITGDRVGLIACKAG